MNKTFHPLRGIHSLLMVLVIQFTGTFTYGQNIPLSLHSDSIGINEFIATLERDYNLTFFYDRSVIPDSLWSAVAFDKISPTEAVSIYFRNFGINTFARDGDIFLTENLRINPGFANRFSTRIEEASSFPTYYINNLLAIAQSETSSEFSEFELIQFGIPSAKLEGQRFKISGSVSEMNTDQPVIGATVQVAGTTLGTATSSDGKYSLSVPSGKHEIIIRAIGKQTAHRQVSIYASGTLDVELSEDITEFEEVVVIGKANDKVNILVGAETLDLSMVKKSVMVMGETDIMKGILAMPGVQTITEVSNGFNVRGGSTDQNLVLIDEVPIMNSSHFFGFFSSFNSDLIENATLYKSGIPANMGGRISSIFDISSKKGSKESWSGFGGISPVTARFGIEGPIIKNRLSFVAGGRSTYSDWLMNRINDVRINNSTASFYDGFFNLHMDLSEESTLSASFYTSKDHFEFEEFLTNQYANLGASLVLDAKIGTLSRYKGSITYSEFDFSISDTYNPAFASESSYEIVQYGFNNTFDFKLSRWLNLSMGADGIYYESKPGLIKPSGELSLVTPVLLENENAVEAAAFLHLEQHITPWLTLSYGIRYSGFVNLGTGTVFSYDPAYSKSLDTLTDTLFYGKGQPIKAYSSPEYRFLAKIMTGSRSSIKISYNRMNQYLNLISNSITPAPTDIWKLCDTYFKPQIGDQYSLGYFIDLVKKTNNILTLSLEAYYKTVSNTLDFKVGADLFANEHFETEVMSGRNKSYGFEAQLNKERGSLYGWVNYSYARSLNRFSSKFPEENINFGEWYPSNHDKPHQVKAVLNYDFFRRISLSANLNYSTGRPLTLPASSFLFGGTKRIQFAERNQYRMPDYFRLDISFTVDERYILDKPMHGSLTLSVVNVTGRKNPYSVFFQYDNRGKLNAYYLSIFGIPIPTITYNLKF